MTAEKNENFTEEVVQGCSVKKSFLRNFTKFTGKHLCQSLFFNKVAGIRPVTLLKKRLWHMCFLVNFMKLLKTLFLTEHLWWLLMSLAHFSSDKMLANISSCNTRSLT